MTMRWQLRRCVCFRRDFERVFSIRFPADNEFTDSSVSHHDGDFGSTLCPPFMRVGISAIKAELIAASGKRFLAFKAFHDSVLVGDLEEAQQDAAQNRCQRQSFEARRCLMALSSVRVLCVRSRNEEYCL
jgi:hypothetical protein